MRYGTRSVAAEEPLLLTHGAEGGLEINRGDAEAAIVEAVPGVLVTVLGIAEIVADPVAVTDAGILAGLKPQGTGLVDLALGTEASRLGQGRACDEQEGGGHRPAERETTRWGHR